MRKALVSGLVVVGASLAYFGCGDDASGVASGGGARGGTGAVGGSGATGSGGGAATGSGGSGATGTGGFGGGGAADGGGAGGSGGSGATGSGGSGASGSGGDSGIPDVTFSYDAPDPGEDACAAVTVGAELVPLDLYVVLDRSGSMVNNGRWAPVRDALNTFFRSPDAAGIGIALTEFAHPFSSQCVASSYATPIVPMAPLPGSNTGHAVTLANTMIQYPSVNAVGTPTASAMTGAVTYARNHKTANPDRTVAIVLATDGIPGASGCSGETAAATQTAIQNGFNGNPSIRTFVIGIDPDNTMRTNLSSWASVSGGQFFDVGTSGGSAAFLQAMKDIQGSLLGCTFSMPKTDAGIINLDSLKVVFTPGSGGPTELPRVNDANACSGAGWYFDDNINPTAIELCAGSCTTVQADPSGSIAIELGCLGS